VNAVHWLCTAAAILFAFCFSSVAAPKAETLDEELEQIRAKYKLPALSGIMMKDGKVVAISAVGVRKIDDRIAATVDDTWHIGSCTKSMTATLAAMLVEQGRMKWSMTVGETFPQWRDEMKPEWRSVTLEMLLTHRAGAPAAAPPDLWLQAWKHAGTPTEQRMSFVHGILTRLPETPPGTKYIYSNQGYAIAGAMLEQITGRAWEEMTRTMIFDPLGMKSAGFGSSGTPGKIDQPWGHVVDGLQLKPVPPGPDSDNPAAIGPAGTVHCSLTDLARYCAMHARGETAGSALLKPESFVKLHTPSAGQDYAMGWFATKRSWAGGMALHHAGSNTMFFTNIWIAPAKNAVIIAATNLGTDKAFGATDDAIGTMIQRFLGE